MSNLALSAVETYPKIETKEGHYKIASTTFVIRTGERVELKSITGEIAAFVEQATISDGIVHVSSLHTTAGLMMNEVQGALLSDMAKHNDPLHSDCDRRNADAHLRAVVVGHSVSIPITEGRLKLGTWQKVLLAEFDGPNNRKVHVQVMGI